MAEAESRSGGTDNASITCFSSDAHKKVPETSRTIHCNNPSKNEEKKFASNYVATSKYTLLSFLPKSLFEQYRRSANLYFTLVAVLSVFPFSPVSYITTIFPLLFVLSVAMFKEGIEDFKRHTADQEINSSKVTVVRNGKLQEIRWDALEVGEIVQLKNGDRIPADLVVLSTSQCEGICYVETMNLDGETNLKIKKALEETQKVISASDFDSFSGIVTCEGPNPSLYTFTGNIDLQDRETKEMKKVPITPVQVLLRGSSLRNVEQIMAVVVYSGHDTKVMQNSTNAPSKRSHIEQQLDSIIYFMFFLLLCMCVVGSSGVATWTSNEGDDTWYLDIKDNPSNYFDPDNPGSTGAFSFLNGLILYGYLIPISLYVSVEIAKVVQSFAFMNLDKEMYHEESDTPCLARTSNLNEELGMIQIIMSDKTGTLTRNIMEFFKCTIAGVAYGRGITEVEAANARRMGVHLEQPKKDPNVKFEKGFNMHDDRLLNDQWVKEAHPDIINKFCTLLAVCHTIVPEGNPTREELKYEAESPDELAFVLAAKELGFFFNKRSTTSVSFVQRMSVKGVLKEVELTYEILAILEFNSTRKRMSLVCRDPDGKLILFCKGADSVIYERLKATDNPFKDVTLEHLAEFASAGLRTLCLAYAEIDDKFFSEWQRKYLDAKTAMQDREQKVDAVAELIEKDLILLGATAIEDKLQEGVPDTIAQLAKAGIGLWMLTGDKVETAINIGFACSLLWNESSQYIIQTEVPEVEQIIASGASKAQLNEKLVQVIHAQLKEALAEISMNEKENPHAHNAVIIDGRALTFALMEECAQTFLALGKRCQSVICCRVSPRQKADVTMLVKEDGMITLGIGDGANDVGMIQAAHVGVGISGQEGMQAALASDYAIGQFRFLGRLLLVHGRYSYKRIARMITYFFYKNVVFGFSLLWFNGMAYFSGQLIYDDVFSSTYNVLFTSLPVLAIGIFDQDVSPELAMSFPQLYKECSQNTYFTNKVKAVWFLNGLYQSLLLTFCVLATYHGTLNSNGKIGGMVATGTALYTCIVITVNLQLAIVVNYWNIFTHLSIFITLFGWFIFVLCYGALPIEYSLEIKDIMPEVLFTQPAFWLVIPAVLLMSVLPDLAIRVVRREWYPCDYQIIQEREKGHGKESDLEQNSIPAPRRMSSMKAKPLYTGGVTPSAPEMLGYFAQLEAENADTPTRFSLGDQQEPVVGTVVGNVDLEMMKRLRSKAKAVKNAAMFLKTTANSMNMLVGSPLASRSPSDPSSPLRKGGEATSSKASASPLRLASPANLANRPNPAMQGHDYAKKFSAMDFPTPKHANASEISEVMDRL